jgi:tetratricopeptide (TPR) repeat protein
MKNTFNILLLCILTISATFGQEANTASNAPVASLRLSDNRTQEKRIEFLLEVAEAYSKEGDFPAAIDAYERILEIDPAHQQVRYLISHIYIRAKEYQKAEAFLLALIKDRPDDFTLLNNLAWVYATAEDPAIRDGEKAIDYAQEALLIAPNDHHIWSTLSEAYYMSGDYEKAYRAIEQMARLATRYGQGITEESVKEYNNQIRKCKRAMDTAEAMKSAE